MKALILKSKNIEGSTLKILFTHYTYVFQEEDEGPDVECQLRTNPGVEELQEDVLELVDYEGHQGEAHPVHVVQPQVHQVLGSVLDGETSPEKRVNIFGGNKYFVCTLRY